MGSMSPVTQTSALFNLLLLIYLTNGSQLVSWKNEKYRIEDMNCCCTCTIWIDGADNMYVQYVPTCIAFIRTCALRTQFPNVRLYLTKLQYFYIREYMQLASAYIHSACEDITHASWINPPYRWFTHLSQRGKVVPEGWSGRQFMCTRERSPNRTWIFTCTHRPTETGMDWRDSGNWGGTCMYDVYAPAAIYIMRIWYHDMHWSLMIDTRTHGPPFIPCSDRTCCASI
jgi:hypothetical protein